MANEKILTPAEQHNLRELVLDLWEIIRHDDTGVTDDLIDRTQVAMEILGIELVQEVEDDDTLPE